MGSLAAQHRRPPNGGGQQQAQRRRHKKWRLAPRETRTSRPPEVTGGGGTHCQPRKEKNKNCPDPPRSPHRPAATHVSMATMETALKDGKHLQRPGSRAGPHLGQDVGDAWTKSLATRAAGNHRHMEFSFAPRDVRVAALSSPRATQHEGYSRHSVTWTGPSKWAWLPQMLRVARPFCGEAQ